jgi:hypothetical protein
MQKSVRGKFQKKVNLGMIQSEVGLLTHSQKNSDDRFMQTG